MSLPFYFFRSQLTHLKTSFPVCEQQSLLGIGRYVTVVCRQGCGWLCSNSGMAIGRGKSNKMRKETHVSATAVMSPGTEPERPDIGPEACRLEVRRNAGRGRVWRFAYSSCSVLGVRVANWRLCWWWWWWWWSGQRLQCCNVISHHSLPQTLPHPLHILDVCAPNLDPQSGRSCWQVLQFSVVHPLYRRYCALTRACPCAVTTVLPLAVCCTVSHSARFSLTCTLRQWQRQMTSSTIHRNSRTVQIIKMERSWNGEGTYCVTEDSGSISIRDKRCFVHCVPTGSGANASSCQVRTGRVCSDAVAIVWRWPPTFV